uniref:Uncharacterized protein n=1 Tax=Panagrolaimus sp. PS1159 TaxID=55785 RepID=A0AC35FB55_9BILA
MKSISILFLSMIIMAIVCSAEADDQSLAKAVPMKPQDIKIKQVLQKFGPKFGSNPLSKPDGPQKFVCCECPMGACDCCPIFGGHCCDD